MPHMLIVGASGCGKTSLAKYIAELREAEKLENRVQIALDPLGSGWPAGVIVVETWDDLLLEIDICAENGEVACVYIDEANLHLAHGDAENLWVMLRGRHFGLDITLITQYPTLLSPAARGQCAKLAVFRIGKKSASMLAEDWAAPGLIDAPELPDGEFLTVTRSPDRTVLVSRGNIFDETLDKNKKSE